MHIIKNTLIFCRIFEIRSNCHHSAHPDMLKLGYFGEPVGDLVGGIAEFFLVLAYIDFEKYIGFYPLLPRTAAYLTGSLK